MANTITLSHSAYKDLISRIAHLEKMVSMLMAKFETEPPYGSRKWWDWADRKGREAKNKGEYISLKTEKDIDSFFASL